MFTVELLNEAEFEVSEACQWYDAKQPGLANRFINELDHYFELISQNPFQFPVKFSETYRFAVLQVFPYFIVYRIDEGRKKVYVISVFNTYRNPESL